MERTHGPSRAAALVLAVVGASAILLAVAIPGRTQVVSPSEYIRGEVLVEYERDAGTFRKAEARSQVEAGGREAIRGSDYEVLSVGVPVPEAVEALRRSPAVKNAEPNYILRLAYSPNDPLYRRGEQYWLPRIQAGGGWNNVPSLGNVAPANSNPEIGVLDSGYDHNHPDLAPKVTREYDCLDDDGIAESGGLSHGTRVAGVAAARTNNGRGIASVAPGAAIFQGRVVGEGGRGSYAEAIECGNAAVAAGAEVLNMSLAGKVYSTAFQEAVDGWNAAGTNVVAAAGNEGCGASPSYPAAFDGVLAVAALDRDNRRAAFSECGPWVDLSAPGVGVLTTDRGGGYSQATGTSFAAPMVAGVLALNRAQGETAPEAASDVLGTATDLGPKGADGRYGRGLVSSANSTDR